MFKGVKFIIKFCWKFSKKFIIYQLLASIIIALVPLILIVMPKFIIDELIHGGNLKKLLVLAFVLTLSTFVGNILSDFLKTKAFINKNIAFKKMQLFLAENLYYADFESIEDPEFLDLKEKAKKFLYGNGKGFASIFDDFALSLSSLLKFLGIVGIITTLNYWITIILILLVLVSSYFDSRYSKILYKIDMEKTPVERRTTYFMELTDDFKYGKELRLYNLKNWLLKKYSIVLDKSHEFYKKSFTKALYNNVIKQIFTFIEQIVMYIYLIISVINKSIGIGDFTMYISAITSFSSSMKTFMSNLVTINQYENYYNELEVFLNMPRKLRNGNNRYFSNNSFSSKIEFKNVYFKYKGQEKYTLENISFKIEKGEKLSIVGENGAGKTTLIKLLLRLYKPTKGEILIDGLNIEDLDYDDYLSLFSAVFQDFKLFATTIKDNICFNDDIKDLEILECIAKSGIEDKINSLNNGIHTEVFKIFSENGIEFSGGQAQKLALARAIFKDAPIVILDEPTAALDPRSEFELYQNFNELSNKKTVIFISHRLSSSKICDKILVLDKGKIIEYGSHDELMINNNKYSELFNMQAKNYI